MSYFWSRIAKPVKSILLFVLVFGAALLVLLYYQGYFDIAFLDRYRGKLDLLREGEQLSSQSDDPFAVPDYLLNNPAGDPPADSSAAGTSAEASGQGEDSLSGAGSDTGSEAGSSDGSGRTAGSGDTPEAAPDNLRFVYDAAVLPDAREKVPSVSELFESGMTYAPETAVFEPGKNALGKLTFDFQLPEIYTDSWCHATSYRLLPMDPKNPDSALISKPVTYIKERLAVEVYMGYLLIENGDKTVLVSSEGEPLCSFETGRYEPAYARDREDRPLFTRERNNGSLLYFHLSADGKNFVLSGYNPQTDSRGLSFDYPADYGKTDTDRIYLDVDAGSGLYGYRIPAQYMPQPEPAAKPETKTESAPDADTDAEPQAESEGESEAEPESEPVREPEPGYLTLYQFRSATPFREGKAAVVAAEPIPTYYYIRPNGKALFPWSERSEIEGQYYTVGRSDGSFVNNSGIDRSVLYFIGEDGKPLFPTGKLFYNEQDRRVFSSCQPPYSYGIESLGSYYFDEGLVRVRMQIIDFWRYFCRIGYTGAEIKVMDEYDALLREDGTEFALPAGFSLKGYSEGRLILSREGKYGVFSVTGEWIAQPIFADAGPFIGGLAPLKTEDGRWGMIDTEGNIVLPFTYDAISQVSSGVIACWREENGWSVLRIME